MRTHGRPTGMAQSSRSSAPLSALPAGSRWVPLKLAAIYLVISVAWISFSSLLLGMIVRDPARITRLEVYKGWLFCLVSAAAMAYFIRRYLQQIHAAQRRIATSEAHYRQLIETAPEAIVLLDPATGRFVEHNPQAVVLFETTDEDLTRVGPADLSPECQPDGQTSAAKAAPYIQQALEGGLVVFEWTHRSRAGRDIPCEIRLLRLPPPGAHLIRGTITDITERRRAADALARSEAGYRTLFEHATDAIFLTAADGRIIEVNQNAVRLTGRTRVELLKRNAFELIVPDDHEDVRQGLQEIEREGAHLNVHRFLRRDGGIFSGEMNTKLLPDGRLLSMVRDVTERRVAEEQRQRLERELRQAQKMQAMGTLAGGIAHDFNNILAAILGNAQLLQLMLPPEHNGHGTLSQILVASHRARDLVQQILLFSRQREQIRQVLQLEPLVKEALKLIGVSLPPSIRLEVAVAPGLPSVLADPTQIHQVIVNLCTNALHAMRNDGGTLQLALSAISLPEESTQSKPDLPPGRYVCLTVADTGHGMDAATMERIYEPFFTTKPVGEGTGLGLAVVHGIVQSNEGAISVASHPGKGTTFKLYFSARAGAIDPEPRPVEGLRAGRGEHIMFVDDEVPIVEVTKAMLVRLGYRVTAFTDARQAFEYLQNGSREVALLITDLSMPGLSGVDLIREAMRLNPDLPVILLTGYGKAFDSKAAVSLNISEVMHKPFTLENLSNAIGSALEDR